MFQVRRRGTQGVSTARPGVAVAPAREHGRSVVGGELGSHRPAELGSPRPLCHRPPLSSPSRHRRRRRRWRRPRQHHRAFQRHRRHWTPGPQHQRPLNEVGGGAGGMRGPPPPRRTPRGRTDCCSTARVSCDSARYSRPGRWARRRPGSGGCGSRRMPAPILAPGSRRQRHGCTSTAPDCATAGSTGHDRPGKTLFSPPLLPDHHLDTSHWHHWPRRR